MGELTQDQEDAIQYINDAPNAKERMIRKIQMFPILYSSRPALTASSTLRIAKKDDNSPTR
jgi:hypothetical protein